jgi:Bacterial protein of unknown function (DUF899)
MTSHKIGTREQWADAREELLAREKEHTLNPHERPFAGVRDRHRAQPPAAAGVSFSLFPRRSTFPCPGARECLRGPCR